ncbi:IS630-like element IS885 family transposase (plasmid) [Cupriavidus necator H16]|uniref:IS630-like element IS885 family transposase n=1 Tax=Cupriavidus necator (strain ATCC 17699 / DSM 428 / KCTC 22496 / NCIMB 10442 / H16 / Stanier 337) TaxID=381666 RepID=Q7WWS7_CUPNH|nr:IS630-like element IS885 family transposase [Cupriavidus necator]AAP86164.1 putative transposase of IS885 [Cupriavidus necator H16]QCC05628.1 IS630-like element IS885 family transposase [Cupriavidus necator H16]QQB81450.1 IS630-like element IS885 family transposase [Cupriavidus necator]
MKCKRNSDGRAIDHHALQVMRQQAIKAVREGQTAQSVAAALGVNVRSVFRWLADYASGGQRALLAKPIPGRPSKVSGDEMRWLAQAVRDNTPQQYKFEFGLWTLSLIRALIHRQFGKELSLSAVSRVMKLLGFSAQKPLYQAWQQDAMLVRRWEAEIYPAIRAEAREVGARIYFADESGIRSDYHTGTTWAPRGQTPVVEATGRRFSLNMISAVSPQGEFRFMLHDGAVTGTVFCEFLQRLMVGADKPVFVVVDGHPIHKAKLVKAYIASLKGQLKLFYLPPYSPHLNPDEQVWAHVKRQVSKRLVQDKNDMKKLALGALRRIQKLPSLVKSFFCQPECKYAAM